MVTPEHKVAIIYKYLPGCLGYGGFLERGIKQICQVDRFIPGEETEGYSDYFYIDDSPTDYMQPKYRPATYFAIDLVLPKLWFLHPPELYFERMQNFDHAAVTNTSALQYCQERGMPVKLIGFAADKDYHVPHNVLRYLDWIAVWHNCGDRIEATNQALQRFPNGKVIWAGNELYSLYMCLSKCALNWLRGNMVNMRVFEVMATDTPLITTRHLDMDYYGFVEGQHYLGYSSLEEMLDKIDWVRDHLDEALRMGQRGRGLVLNKHTYFHRALEILNWLYPDQG